jgi:hypothetical protein
MLACKKCHRDLTEGLAQQSLCEMEAALLTRWSPIQARRNAMNHGPLCDPCLARWQDALKDDSPSTAIDTRSPAIKRLDSACTALGRSTGVGTGG